MKRAKNGVDSLIRVGYDGRVHKTFQGNRKRERFENEVNVLRELELRECGFVPRLIDANAETLQLITTSCGTAVEKMSAERVRQIFRNLEEKYGVVHKNPLLRNITYDHHCSRFCVINFEVAHIMGSFSDDERATSLSWAGVSRSGSRKPQNEDNIDVFSIEHGWAREESVQDQQTNSKDLVFTVSDGMGGHAAGDVASQMVVSHLRRFIPAKVGDQTPVGSSSALLDRCISDMHNHVLRFASGKPKYRDMGATVVCAYFANGHLHYGHVGDSRLYRFRRGRLAQITLDHSYVGRLLREGKINEREARLNPRRNILTQAIGARCQFVYPQIGSLRVRPDDWYLLCSDGVIDGLWDKEIEEEFQKVDNTQESVVKVANRLLDRAYEEAGNDDTTLFVINAS